MAATIKAQNIKSIALFGHGGSGKTSLVEAILHQAGALDRVGRVEDGNTVSDYDPDEIRRHISLYSTPVSFINQDYKFNLLDNPGFLDFVGELQGSIRACETALLVAQATSGLEVGLEKVWFEYLPEEMPAVFFISKMDKENADFYKTLDALQALSSRIIPLFLPIGKEADFKGLVSIVTEKAYLLEGKERKEIPVPADLKDKLSSYKEKLHELAAEGEDDLLEKYLETLELSPEEMLRGLKGAIKHRKLIPVVPGSSTSGVGVPELLDVLGAYTPSLSDQGEVKGFNPDNPQKEEIRKTTPEEKFSGLVFKTTTDPYVGKLTFVKVFSGTLRPDCMILNPDKEFDEKITSLFMMKGKAQEQVSEALCGDIVVVTKLQKTATGDNLCDKTAPIMYPKITFPEPVLTMAIHPKSRADEDKMGTGLNRLAEEDQTFKVGRNNETKETLASGIGDLHIEVMVERLKRKFGVEVELSIPRVAYKETIRGTSKVEGKYKKQSGGRGQYGHVWLDISPLERGKDFEFLDQIVGGVVPKNFIPSVEKGVRKAMENGAISGNRLVDIKVGLYDGSYHTVDSSDIAFQQAAIMAIKKGVQEANPVILEPIMNVEVDIPDTYMGDIMGDLNGKRGRIMGMEPLSRQRQRVKAQAPLVEMQRYAIDLRSMTQGRGNFRMNFSHYEEVPPQIQEQIVQAAAKEKQESED